MSKHERHRFRVDEVYCLKQVEPGRYIELNRDYQPLGMKTQEAVHCQNLPLVSLPGMTPQIAARLSARGSDDVTHIYLYDDGCVPTGSAASMHAYRERRALLARIKVPPSPRRTLSAQS
jgi:hypothetical protein